MNIAMCILAGAVLGWSAYTFFGFNAARGRMASVLIGAAGGFLGGELVAPMFTAVAAGDLSLPALVFAAGLAAAFIALASLIHERWGV
jgi:uncharacterized membrane protein YeaQ/YmgE (transglycosylase-associated protein family)